MQSIPLKVAVDTDHRFPAAHAGIGVILARIPFCRKHGLRAGQIVRLVPELQRNQAFAYFKIVPAGLDSIWETYSNADAVVEPFIPGPEGDTVFTGKAPTFDCALTVVNEPAREESAFVLKLDTQLASQGPTFTSTSPSELRALSRFVGEHKTPLNNGYVLLFNGGTYVVCLAEQRSPGVAGPRSTLRCYIQYLLGVKQGYEKSLMDWQRKRYECETARDTLDGEMRSAQSEEMKLQDKLDDAWARYTNALVEYLEELKGGLECVYEGLAAMAVLEDFSSEEIDGGKFFSYLDDIDNNLKQVNAAAPSHGRLQSIEAVLKSSQKELVRMRSTLKTCVEKMEAKKGFLGDYSRGAGPTVDFEP